MNHDDMRDMSMWDDPDESPAVRQLLRTGRAARMNPEYDVERGLARHLANLQAGAGAPLPPWAAGMTVQKAATSSLLAWLLPPIAGAGLLGAWLFVRPVELSAPSLRSVNAAPVAAALRANEVSQQPEPTTVPARSDDSTDDVVAAVAATDANDRGAAWNNDDAARGTGRSAARASRSGHRANSAHREAGLARSHRSGVNSDSASPVSASVPGSANIASSASTPTDSPAAVARSATAEARQAAPEPSPSAQDRVDSAGAVQRAAAVDERESAGAATAQPARSNESDSKLEREMQMLAVAQRILVEDPARALRLTRQGEQEFRGSMFSAERKQVSLLALVQLGRLEEARRLGASFLRAYPNAPWSARLREALRTGRLPTR